MDQTLEYYNQNAESFRENTQNVDMHFAQEKFLHLLPEKEPATTIITASVTSSAAAPVTASVIPLAIVPATPSILDFGCGSGRDTKYFLDRGYTVTATDGSSELCRIAGQYTGIHVRQMLFQELDQVNQYDGIWACSSILHLPKGELLPVLRKMSTALKSRGVIYTSFKYSSFEGLRKGRYFTDFTEDTFQAFLAAVPELTIEEYWITGDVRPGRGEEKWLNLILRKAKNNLSRI